MHADSDRLSALTLIDEHRLRRRRGDLSRPLAAAEARIARRRAAVPPVTYPDLPVSQRRDELAAAIAEHQVVIVAGETGSGKTTQLPKICLELGRGIRGTIGHTQPRRLAARTVAERIAAELDVPLGGAVGYTVRFTDQVSDTTLVRLMTDGILLAEIRRDRRLLRYDTLIIDEAHERSLNVDFLLGYLAELLPQRPDLKVIVTSATIDPGRFAAHFGGAPVVEVSGRTYPVEVRYRPPAEGDDQIDGVVAALAELPTDGDVLVFLSGEREIRDTAEALRGVVDGEVLPLYARLAVAEQHKVWQPHAQRRVVLATNVAETSLTVPGIKYVIDPGTARISRYSLRTKVQRLPIEPISQASANQRAGRCGRTSDGVCIRLYAEDDFDARPRFTDPEILRTNLASVILQMTALGLGDLERFPFLDPPDRRSVRDGVALLAELGALSDGRLTDIGRQLAQLPVDPRIARMIVQAGVEGSLRDVLIVAAALSIPDPRERPSDQRAQADQQHARFADENSDFVALLNLWTYVRSRRRELSGNQFRRMCRDEHLNYLRIREWQDLRGQLRQIASGLGLTEDEQETDPARVHAAILTGLLSHVGLQSGREYLGARNARFVIAPGTPLARKPPRWVVAAELVETSRLYARTVARIDPETVEKLASHLVVRNYSEPHWERRRAAVMAYERVTLYGIPLVTRRSVSYARVDPELSRELFIRHALVEGDWETRHAFFRENRALLESLSDLEDRTRRRDLIADDDTIFAFYDQRIPADVLSGRHFDAWWKKADRTLLTLSRADVLTAPVDDEHPDVWDGLPVSYRFDPGAADDGVTVHVPVEALARLGGTEFGWQVPALRAELVVALIRSLPKDLRRRFVPVPDTARAVLAAVAPGSEPLLDAVQRELHRISGVLVPQSAFDLDKVPAHLRVTFAVEGPAGELARGKDLSTLQAELAAPVRAAVAAAFDIERAGLTDWPADLDELPRQVTSGATVGYPALVGAAIRVLPTESEQAAAMPLGTRALLRATVPSPARAVLDGMGPRARLVLGGNLTALVDDAVNAGVDALVAEHGLAWTRSGFTALRDHVRAGLPAATAEALRRGGRALAAAQEVRSAWPSDPPTTQRHAVADMSAQLDRLLPPGFLASTGLTRLADLPRYVQAIGRRLEKLPRDPELDRALMWRVQAVTSAWDQLRSALPPLRAGAADVADIGWQIEELRVSLFAQQLGTSRPVSEQRIFRAIDAVAP